MNAAVWRGRALDAARRLEVRALAIFVAACAALWAFIDIADGVSNGETASIDRRIVLGLRNPADLADPIGPRGFEEAVRDVTALGGFTVLTLVTVLATVALAFHGKRRQALVLAVTVALAELSTELLKLAFGRDRPDLVPHGGFVYSNSFPSGHSTLSAATFLTLAAILASLEPERRAKAVVVGVAVLLVAAIGASRVYLGVHWPSDVLGGWALGATWALLARLALGRVFKPA